MIIYWRCFVPRVLILAVIVFLAWMNQETLIALVVQHQLKSRTGAAVQIESIGGDLLKGNVVINNLSVHDRKNPSRKPLCAAKITAEGDFKNIAKRYFVFPKIKAEGIQITVDGVDAQQFMPDKFWLDLQADVPALSAAGETLAQTDWTQFFSQKPEDAAKNILTQLKTSKIANELNTKWADDVKKIEASAKDIESRFNRIKQILNKQNPSAQQTPQVQQFLTELNAIGISVQKFLTDVNQLNEKAKNDYQSLLASVEQDRNNIKSIAMPKFSTDSISESLIGPEVKEQWMRMLAWSEWVRSLLLPENVQNNSAPERSGFSMPKHFGGETINFAALDARPDVLIETLDFTGKTDFGTLPLFFNGRVQNAAFSMHLAPAPAIIQCCFSGRGIPVSPVQTEAGNAVNSTNNNTEIIGGLPDIFAAASIDRIGQNETDELVFHCPKYRLPARILGKEGHFAVAVSPGISQLDGTLVLNSGKLSGRIRIFQSETKLSAVLPAKMQNTVLHQTIQNTLNSLDGFNAEILVSGTKESPQYVFKSDIADKLRSPLEQILQTEWDEIKQLADTQMTAEANAAVDALRAAVNDKISPLTAQINAEQQQWQQFQGKTLEEAVREGAEKLQKKLPGILDKYLNKP